MSVKVEAVLKHNGHAVGDTYEVPTIKAKALEAIGLVKPGNQTAAKKIEKAGAAD
ncbi:hypothetical protein SAMN05892877_117150 [Rhizobium subbaraonis]|uniref:Uncharacterized protein n=1 Tax=Rhizobium subbaraonis TaxID=908946 RepID=A0A285UZT9_9HYPH|nr:hypothetical protein [Rhizobium subbaraonis]SOC45761.1 hypothetical protein SAMN05892877_117150 [Rhizobium subbaraonis]